MRILYGVQGTGNGHISRCRMIARALQREQVAVDYVLSGREAHAYFDMDEFGEYKSLPGLTFVTRDGSIDLLATVGRSQLLRLLGDIKQLPLHDYDFVVSDFEPVTAWAAKKNKIPSLGISHQASFNYGIPQKGNNMFGRLMMRHFAPVHHAVGLHWYHFGFPILPPVIETLQPPRKAGIFWCICPLNLLMPFLSCYPALNPDILSVFTRNLRCRLSRTICVLCRLAGRAL